MISLVTAAARVGLANGTAPPVPALPEADASDMDYFVSQLQIVLPVLGVNAIRVSQPRASTAPTAPARIDSPIFELINKKWGVAARAQQIDGEFTMLASSVVVSAVRESDAYSESTARAYAAYRAHHERLVADGSIVVDGDRATVARNIVFSSPSTAGAIALGRSCNGRDAWTSAEGSFGQWESRGLDEPPLTAAP